MPFSASRRLRVWSSPVSKRTPILFSSRTLCVAFALLTVLAISPVMHVHATEAEHWRGGNNDRVAAAATVAVPGAPTNLSATASGTDTINLSWTAPTNNGGSAITGYRIEVLSRYESNIGRVNYDEETPEWHALVKNTGNTNVSYSHTGLSPNTVVNYRVSAINDDGAGEPSNEDEARTGLVGSGTAPTISSVVVNDTEMEITFDQTLDANSIPNEVFFPIKVSGNGGDYRPQDVTIQGTKVTPTLAEENGINHGETVHVRYYQPTYVEGDVFLPTTGGLKSPAGNPVEKTGWNNVTNNTPQRIELVLDRTSINEDGGTTTLTATIPSAVTQEITLTITPEPVAPAVDADFTVSGTTLTIAQGATTSTDTLTITAVGNDVKEGHKTVMFRVLRENYPINEVAAKPFTVDLTIIDDETPPPVFTLPPEIAPAPGPTPDPPLYLRGARGNAQATLTWNPPFYDTGDITGYAYRYKESDQVFGADAPATWHAIPGGVNARSYTVTGLTNGLEYMFEVRAENANGGGTAARVTVRLPESVNQSADAGIPATVNTENEELPTEVALLGNYPNPFNPETTIDYKLPQTSEVSLTVYDLLGHEAAVLVDGLQSAGRHSVRFDAGNLPSGPYVYRLRAGDKTIVRTMILVK